MIINSNLICSMNFKWENIAVHCSKSRIVTTNECEWWNGMCGWWLGTIRMGKGHSDIKMMRTQIFNTVTFVLPQFSMFSVCVQDIRHTTNEKWRATTRHIKPKNKRRINVDLFVYVMCELEVHRTDIGCSNYKPFIKKYLLKWKKAPSRWEHTHDSHTQYGWDGMNEINWGRIWCMHFQNI